MWFIIYFMMSGFICSLIGIFLERILESSTLDEHEIKHFRKELEDISKTRLTILLFVWGWIFLPILLVGIVINQLGELKCK